MADVTTTYDVNVRYLAQNMMSVPASQMVTSLNQVTQASDKAKLGLGRLGAFVAGAFGLNEARKSLIGFNSDLEQNRITMAGLWQQYKGGEFTDNLEKASGLMKQLQLDARASVGTTKDFVNMASMLVGPIAMAGGNMEQLQAMTKSAVVGSRAFAMDWQVAARDVDQALRGQYHATDQFTGKLLSPMGFSGEEGRSKFNSMSAADRFSTLQRAMSSQALLDMAKAQETSFEGVTSTLVDNIQMALGKVGLPLFKSITEEIKSWNDWLDANQARVSEITKTVSDVLLKGFQAVKDVAVFLVDHLETLKVALYGFLAVKGAGVLGGLAGMMGSAGGSLLGAGAKFAAADQGKFLSGGSFAIGFRVAEVGAALSTLSGAPGGAATGGAAGSGILGAAGGLTGFAAKLGVAGAALATFATLAQGAADWMNASHERGLANAGKFDASTLSLFEGAKINKGGAKALLSMAKMQGFADEKGNVNEGVIRAGLEEASLEDRKKWVSALGMDWNARNTYAEPIAAEATKQIASLLKEALINTIGGPNMSIDPNGSVPKPTPTKVQVNINRIEVQSDDPDRFVFQLGRAGADAIRNPSASRFQHTFREG